jgi:hypothetical protein
VGAWGSGLLDSDHALSALGKLDARAATWQATVATAVAGVEDEGDREALEEFAASVALACELATSPT